MLGRFNIFKFPRNVIPFYYGDGDDKWNYISVVTFLAAAVCSSFAPLVCRLQVCAATFLLETEFCSNLQRKVKNILNPLP